MLRSVTIAVLSLLCLAPSARAEGYRLGTAVTPTYQFVDMKIDPSQKGYSGLTRIVLRIDEPADVIRLHAEEIEITKTRLDGPNVTIPLKLDRDKTVVTLRPPRTLPPGSYSLRIDFRNEFNRRAVGLYKMEAGGDAYAFTQFEAIDARKAFPCFDEPSFKQPFQLRLTVRESDEAVTNMPVAWTSREGGWKTIEFARTPPMPVYLVALAVGPMDSVPVEGLDIPGRIYTPRGQAKLASIGATMVAPILAWQERWFRTKYPYEKLDFIAIPEYWPGAMEHPGAVTFADGIMLLDPDRASPDARRRLAQIIAHELAHMWFGDLVTMQWWDELWLNESFADWFGDKTTEALYPEFQVQLAELQKIQNIMFADARASAEAIRKPVDGDVDLLGDVGLAYDKGKAVLSMWERWLGEENFRRGVNAYLHEHVWGNARAHDLFTALSTAAGQPVGEAMTTFLDQPGMPLVALTTLDGGRVALTQRRLANAGTALPAQSWSIPVSLRYSNGTSQATKTVLLDGASREVELVPGGNVAWIMPLADATGYYRWNVDHDAMLALAANAQRDLNAAERIAFLGNLRALLDAGLVHGDDYFRALRAFGGDPEPRVVDAVIGGLQNATPAFVHDDLDDEYAAWLRATLRPALDRIGIDRREGEAQTASILRPDLIRLLGMRGGDRDVIAWSSEQAARFMSDPHSVEPSTAAAALAVTARRGDEALFDAIAARLATAKTPAERSAYLGALGAFRAAPSRRKALALSLEAGLRPNEMFTIPFGGFDTATGRDETYAWFTSNYDAIASRMPPLYLPFLVGIAGGCEEERVVAARAFFLDPKRMVEGMEKRLEQTEQQVKDCVGLRKREGSRVAEYFRNPS